MKNVLYGFILGVIALMTPAACQAASVISNQTLTSSAVVSDLKAAPVNAIAGGTLTVTVTSGNEELGFLVSNPAVFVSLDNIAIGTVRAADLISGSLPGFATLQKVFSINAATMASIVNADNQVLFKFRSGTATPNNPYNVSAVLSYASIPEPTSMAILGLGACALAGFVRRRK